MTKYVLPASPNWYCSRVTDANKHGVFVFGAKHSIFVWNINVKPPRHLGYFRAHQERVVGLSLCRHLPSQPRCCSAGEDGKVKIWDLDSQTQISEHSEQKVELSVTPYYPLILENLGPSHFLHKNYSIIAQKLVRWTVLNCLIWWAIVND